MAKSFEQLKLLHFGTPQFKKSKREDLNEVVGVQIKIGKLHFIKGLKKHIRNFDIIVVGFDPHWINAFFLPVTTNQEIVYWGHGLGENAMFRVVRKWMFHQAEAFVTYHEKDRKQLIDEKLPSDKIYSANNTIAVENSEDMSSCDKTYFLFVGRLQARKELGLVIKALAKLKKRGIRKKLLIVGNGEEEKQNLIDLVRQLDLDEIVQFIDGTTDEKVLKKIFSEAIAYVSPGHVGLGVLHSFAYGIPVITLRKRRHAPEFNNIMHGENGYIIEEEELENLLSSSVQEYKTLGCNAYHYYSKNARINNMVDGFMRAINHASYK